MGSIGVLGATGYTGSLIARELAARDVDGVTLTARSRAKLDRLAATLTGWHPSVATATPDDPATLEQLGDWAVAINTVGPFTDMGEPVVAAAVKAGIHYVDTTGEQGYMQRIKDGYDQSATDRGVAVICAQAFEYALGDCAAAIAVDKLGGAASQVDVYYHTHGGGMSRGTRKSIVRAVAQPMLSWVDRRLVKERVGSRRGVVTLPGESRPRAAVAFPGGEPLHVPRGREVGTVRSWLVVPRKTAKLMGRAGWLSPLLKLGWVQRAADRRIERAEDAPGEASRSSATFTVMAVASRDGDQACCTVTGSDPYKLTAIIAVEGAMRLLDVRPARAGVVSTSMAFAPGAFLDSLPVDWSVQTR